MLPVQPLPTPNGDEEDRSLLARTATGDAVAFEALVRRHEGSLLRFATRTCASSVEAQDTVQDGLLAVWRAASTYRGEGAVRAWMFRVVVHACRHRQRRHVGEPTDHCHLEDARELATPEDTPEEAASTRELGSAIDQALRGLSEEARAVLVLRDVEQFSGEEVADILGIGLASMKSRLHRARLDLKALLEAHLGSGAKESRQ